jgi:hypothetical protein
MRSVLYLDILSAAKDLSVVVLDRDLAKQWIG